jgi:hypothetical protein
MLVYIGNIRKILTWGHEVSGQANQVTRYADLHDKYNNFHSTNSSNL